MRIAILRDCRPEERNIAGPTTLVANADGVGLNGNAVLDQTEAKSVKEQYVASTQEALNCGVFGIPSYLHKRKLFWGQDRLDFLEQNLNKA